MAEAANGTIRPDGADFPASGGFSQTVRWRNLVGHARAGFALCHTLAATVVRKLPFTEIRAAPEKSAGCFLPIESFMPTRMRTPGSLYWKPH